MNYYTFAIGRKYEKLAKEFITGMDKFGISVRCFKSKDTGDWMKNCMIRSHIACFLPPPYWFFDADLRCISNQPKDYELFKEKVFGGGDLFLNERPNCKPNDHFSAGIIGVLSDKGQQVMKRWSELCFEDAESTTPLREQLYLHNAVQELKPCVFSLEEKYNFVPSKVKQCGIRALRKQGVILLHLPASRSND